MVLCSAVCVVMEHKICSEQVFGLEAWARGPWTCTFDTSASLFVVESQCRRTTQCMILMNVARNEDVSCARQIYHTFILRVTGGVRRQSVRNA